MKKTFFIDHDQIIKFGQLNYALDKIKKPCYTLPMIKSLQLSDDLFFVVALIAGMVLIFHPITIFIALYLIFGKYVRNLFPRADDTSYDNHVSMRIFTWTLPWLVLIIMLVMSVKGYPEFGKLIKSDLSNILDNRIYTLTIHPQLSENKTGAAKYENARRH